MSARLTPQHEAETPAELREALIGFCLVALPNEVGFEKAERLANRFEEAVRAESAAELAAVRAERDEARTDLAKYVGHEPTIAEEMAYLSRCLHDVHAVCDGAEEDSLRWENPLPVPEWVAVVREAADGVRPDDPNDRRRRIYIDGKGNAWLDQSVTSDNTRWIAPLAGSMPGGSEPEATVRERTGSLREIGRCW